MKEQAMKKRVTILVCLALVAIGSVGVWYAFFRSVSKQVPEVEVNRKKPVETPASKSFPAAAPMSKSAAVPRKDQDNPNDFLGYESAHGPMPVSLRGVEVPGKLEVDEYGNLVISRDILHVFDFFLAGSNEEPRETSIARIREYLGRRLPQFAAGQAEKILDDFIAYKNALAGNQPYSRMAGLESLMDPAEKVATIRAALETRGELRRQFMASEVVSAFFSEEEAYDQYSLKLIELNFNPDLSPKEKQKQMAAFEQMLPERLQARRREARRLRMEAEKKTETLQVQN